MRPASTGHPRKAGRLLLEAAIRRKRALRGCLDLLFAFRISRNFHLILQSGDLIEFLHFDSCYHFLVKQFENLQCYFENMVYFLKTFGLKDQLF